MEYEVSVRNTFEADSFKGATEQMIAWLQENAWSAAYRVTNETDSLLIDPDGWHIMGTF